MSVFYKNYVIKPATMLLKDVNKWSTHVYIVKHDDDGSNREPFYASYTFEAKEAAEKYCVIFAKEIIDGKHKHLSLEGL